MKPTTGALSMRTKAILLSIFGLVVVGAAHSREQVKIVGSSTVYPFSSFVAEEFGSVSRYPTPVVESTGTGGGVKLFCSDNTLKSPDIVNASRRIKIKEFNLCERNGVKNISEFMFGYDGIVLAQSAEENEFAISMSELMLALIKKVPNKDNTGLIENPYMYWNQINPKLPKRKISVYGPPLSSGTREAFEEIVLQYQTEEMKVYRDSGLNGYHVIRTDGVYIPSGENDNLIVQKLTKDKLAIGIFGYSFLVENEDALKSVTIDGITPTKEEIASKRYPISRSLYFYSKNDNVSRIPAIREYMDMFLSEDLVGEEGLLSEIGLIPMSKNLLDEQRQRIAKLPYLKIEELEKNVY